MFINPITMHLHIAPNRLISEVQKEFNRLFPFLKIEFFNNRMGQRSGGFLYHIYQKEAVLMYRFLNSILR